MKNLKPKQQQAALLLVQGKSKKTVAGEVGVTPETISSWCSDPYFEAFVNHLQQEALDESLKTIRRAAGKAADKLEDLIENAESESTKLNACIAVLKMLNFDNHEKLAWRRMEIGHTDPSKIIKQKQLVAVNKKESDESIFLFNSMCG